ncbi:MAG: porin family protein [Pseudomonadota bacterium]
MKKFLLGTVALLALGVTANAADLPARAYTKAPPMVSVYSWTGFYLNAGGGYGMWEADTSSVLVATGQPLTFGTQNGGRGYFGTVGGGFDYQFAPAWVAGVFADAQFGDIKGTISDPFRTTAGSVKNDVSWAVGARLGYLIAPNVLSYVNAGYSHAEFTGTTQTNIATNTPNGLFTQPFDRSGWFVGGGVEHSLNIFGFSAPGLFMKTEYRLAEYDRTTLPMVDSTGAPTATGVTFKPYVQTFSTQLVYRFNYGR